MAPTWLFEPIGTRKMCQWTPGDYPSPVFSIRLWARESRAVGRVNSTECPIECAVAVPESDFSPIWSGVYTQCKRFSIMEQLGEVDWPPGGSFDVILGARGELMIPPIV